MPEGLLNMIKKLKTKVSPNLEYGKNAEGIHQLSGGLSVSQPLSKKINLIGEINENVISGKGFNEISKPSFKAGVSVNLGQKKKEAPKKEVNL